MLALVNRFLESFSYFFMKFGQCTEQAEAATRPDRFTDPELPRSRRFPEPVVFPFLLPPPAARRPPPWHMHDERFTPSRTRLPAGNEPETACRDAVTEPRATVPHPFTAS